MKVAIIAGGPSVEAEVSRTSARSVRDALTSAGHDSVILELDGALPAALGEAFDVAFPVVHGPLGEDGCLQGLLEVLDLPYVGAGVLASALGADKPAAKVLFRAMGLPVAEEAILHRPHTPDLSALVADVRASLGRAVVVKPAAAGSAIGVTRVTAGDSDDALAAALAKAFEVGPRALVERMVVGKEVTCGVLDDEDGRPSALPPTLILPKAADWYDFESRYAAGGSEHRCPAPFDEALTLRIQEIAVGAHRALGVRDLSRVDFVVGDGDDDRRVTLLEVNTLPGFTATSLFPEAAAARGIAFPALCDRLVRLAFGRPRRERPMAVPMP